MKMFALQNMDYKEFYWNSEYGWTDLEASDKFIGSELEEDYCIELKRKGKWVQVDVPFSIENFTSAQI